MKKRIVVALGLLSLLLGVFILVPKTGGSRYYPHDINLMTGQRFYSPDDRDRFITYSGEDDSTTFIISEIVVSKSGFGLGMITIEYRVRVGDNIWIFGDVHGRLYRVIRGSSDNIVLVMVGHYRP